ncbi:FMN-dependent NADH-azoreductase [Seinonella peptonophila]|uniref:FMN-dependent NADH-azoreductase n=1 Tax=Seinonella peptonophila TaxID=112248 RepID=UPI0009341701|nr:FMN-dependent NADH-azoreductase [Seinonella peptonophila]
MSKVLIVKANDRPADQSVSVKMYDAFVHTYRETHPTDQIEELDLYQVELPYFGALALSGLFKRGNQLELTEEEQKIISIIDERLEQFLAADKVVFAFPLWNFSVPAVLHTYIDYLSQAGKTFRYTENGPVGLIPDKKVAFLNATGGEYSTAPAGSEHSISFMKNVFHLFGVKDPTVVLIEGHNQYPDRSAEIIEEGLQEVVKTASTF